MNEFIEEVKDLLEERSAEIERYLIFVEELIDSKGLYLAKYNEKDLVKASDYEINRTLIKTLSATSYLLIYNLIESVMTHLLDSVHKQLVHECLAFSQLSEKLKKICLKNFNKIDLNNQTATLNSHISLDDALIWIGYNRRGHFSGNVNAKEIQAKARAYGFEIGNHDRQFTNDGEILNIIREKRNVLAHGDISFEACGQDTAIDSLIKLHKQTYIYLNAVLDGVNQYLIDQSYRNG